MSDQKTQNWVKRHSDTIFIIVTVIGCFWTVQSTLTEMEKRLSALDKEISIVKAVMLMQKILPPELAVNGDTH